MWTIEAQISLSPLPLSPPSPLPLLSFSSPSPLLLLSSSLPVLDLRWADEVCEERVGKDIVKVKTQENVLES